MPRPRKPARLYYRHDEGQWIVRDGAVQHRTGFGLEQRGQAETALAEYLVSGRKAPERRGPANPSELTVGEVLARYADDKGATLAAPATLAYSIAALAPFWGNLACDAVKGSTCRAYGRSRACKPSTVRRELGVLQAALNHAHGEGLLIHPVKVSLPNAGEPKDRWLTRSEAASLVRAAPPHLRRFILLSLYTGRRMSAVLELTWTRVDLDAGVIRFRADGDRETNKRRGRVRIARQLRAHLRRWQAADAIQAKGRKSVPGRAAESMYTHVVSFRGKPVKSVKRAFTDARTAAGLGPDVTRHTLKHTALTWAVMAGADIEDAAEYFDTSPATIRTHYWHHSPHHQDRALAIVERRR